MAIFTPGPAIGAISGSIGGSVFSHNKGGPYIRNRTIPTASQSAYAVNAKARLAQISQAWQLEDAATQLAWREWAKTNPISNALGQSRTVPGHVAYIRVNTCLMAVNLQPIVLPPILPAPEPLTSLSVTADIGPGNFEIVYLATPLGATEKLMVWAALVDSPGINYVENLYKLVLPTDLAQASPLAIQTAVEIRFGSASVGQTLFVKVQTVADEVGLPSIARVAKTTVVDTT